MTMYRSPIAFKSHAIWIFGGGVGPCDCGCFHRRYDDVARQVKTILNTVEPITEDIKALPTVFDLIPIEIHTQAESLTFGPGEVVWVILTVPWTHLESSIDVWPGVIMSQDVSRYSVQLLPAYREHWILEENILPWASMTDIEKYTRSVSSIQTPSAATILMFNPVSSECVWTERVGMLVAAFNTAKTITDNISHFDIHTEGSIRSTLTTGLLTNTKSGIQKTGIFLGAERIIPGHLVRLKLRRDDLSKYDNFRTTSETAYSNMKQNEDAHRATNNILYLSVEDIQFTESSRTYVLMGRLVELIEDYGDISEGVLLEDVVPPRGYRLCTVLEHGCGAAVSLHLVSGRYYPRIMYHSFFDYEPFENCMHLAVLEGLFLQRGDISHNTYRYNGTSRPHAITAALHKNI